MLGAFKVERVIVNKIHSLILVTLVTVGLSSSHVSATFQSEIQEKAKSLWRIATQRVPGIAWTATKACVCVYSGYRALQTLHPELTNNVLSLRHNHSNELMKTIFKNATAFTAFGFLSLKAGESFMNDLDTERSK